MTTRKTSKPSKIVTHLRAANGGATCGKQTTKNHLRATLGFTTCSACVRIELDALVAAGGERERAQSLLPDGRPKLTLETLSPTAGQPIVGEPLRGRVEFPGPDAWCRNQRPSRHLGRPTARTHKALNLRYGHEEARALGFNAATQRWCVLEDGSFCNLPKQRDSRMESHFGGELPRLNFVADPFNGPKCFECGRAMGPDEVGDDDEFWCDDCAGLTGL